MTWIDEQLARAHIADLHEEARLARRVRLAGPRPRRGRGRRHSQLPGRRPDASEGS